MKTNKQIAVVIPVAFLVVAGAFLMGRKVEERAWKAELLRQAAEILTPKKPAPHAYPDYTSSADREQAAQTQYLRELRDMAEQELRDAEFERKFGFRKAR